MKLIMTLKSFFPRFLKSFLLMVYKNQFKLGLSDVHLTHLSEVYSYSKYSNSWNLNSNIGIGGWFRVPNTSSGYHGLLVQWWTKFGLGSKSLLISETIKVRQVFEKEYPDTNFTCTDFYTDLLVDAETDVLWNLYHPIPDQIGSKKYDSVICQATFEHLIDPVGVLNKMVALCNPGAHIYLHTHTPYYPKHSWPSDYLRYYPEWFFDVCDLIPNLQIIEVYSEMGHVFALFVMKENN
jgi:hypothetical protein